MAETELGNREIAGSYDYFPKGGKTISTCRLVYVCSQAFYVRKGEHDRLSVYVLCGWFHNTCWVIYKLCLLLYLTVKMLLHEYILSITFWLCYNKCIKTISNILSMGVHKIFQEIGKFLGIFMGQRPQRGPEMTSFVVYFDQSTGALQVVYWLKWTFVCSRIFFHQKRKR